MGHLSIQHTKLNQINITKQIFRVFQIAVKGRGGGGGVNSPQWGKRIEHFAGGIFDQAVRT